MFNKYRRVWLGGRDGHFSCIENGEGELKAISRAEIVSILSSTFFPGEFAWAFSLCGQSVPADRSWWAWDAPKCRDGITKAMDRDCKKEKRRAEQQKENWRVSIENHFFSYSPSFFLQPGPQEQHWQREGRGRPQGQVMHDGRSAAPKSILFLKKFFPYPYIPYKTRTDFVQRPAALIN